MFTLMVRVGNHSFYCSHVHVAISFKFVGEWAKTASGEDFLIAEDGQGKDKIIFATNGNIKLLCEAETIYIGGTFQTCPSLFYQVLMIHAFKNGKQFPLVYAVLHDKTQATYIRSFELIKQKATTLLVLGI